jgi:hypothetical protein
MGFGGTFNPFYRGFASILKMNELYPALIQQDFIYLEF